MALSAVLLALSLTFAQVGDTLAARRSNSNATILQVVPGAREGFTCEDFTLDNDSAGRGVQFDIDTQGGRGQRGRALIIDNFWIFPEDDVVDEPVYIWVTKDKRTFKGIEEDEDAWELLASTRVTGRGGQLLDLGLQLNHWIQGELEYGVYISFENARLLTESFGGDTFSFTDFTLDSGYFLDGNFTGVRGRTRLGIFQEFGFSGVICLQRGVCDVTDFSVQTPAADVLPPESCSDDDCKWWLVTQNANCDDFCEDNGLECVAAQRLPIGNGCPSDDDGVEPEEVSCSAGSDSDRFYRTCTCSPPHDGAALTPTTPTTRLVNPAQTGPPEEQQLGGAGALEESTTALGAGPMIGIIVGVVGGIALIGVGVLLLIRARKRKRAFGTDPYKNQYRTPPANANRPISIANGEGLDF